MQCPYHGSLLDFKLLFRKTDREYIVTKLKSTLPNMNHHITLELVLWGVVVGLMDLCFTLVL